MLSGTHEKARARSGFPTFWVLMALIVGILIMGDLTRRMTDARRMERDGSALAIEVATLEAENARLESELAGAGNQAQVEGWARAEARWVRDGERLVIPLPAPGTAPTPVPQSSPALQPPSAWEVWWALLVGG
jgi:hypothetical protein